MKTPKSTKDLSKEERSRNMERTKREENVSERDRRAWSSFYSKPDTNGRSKILDRLHNIKYETVILYII